MFQLSIFAVFFLIFSDFETLSLFLKVKNIKKTKPFLTVESQKKLNPVIGTVVIMDGRHGTNNSGFTLYHLLSEDNNQLRNTLRSSKRRNLSRNFYAFSLR